MYSEHTLRKRVIRATFIVCNKKLYQISSHGLKIKSQQILPIINLTKKNSY